MSANRVIATAAAVAAGAGLVYGASAAATATAAPTSTSTTASSSASALCPKIPGRMWCLSERASVAAPTVPGSGMRPNAMAPASTTPYGPSDLRSAYNVPTSTTTATVAVIDAYDAPNVASDLAEYRSTFGLPACTVANGCFSVVNQQGATSPLPASDSGWAGETTLDVQMVSAICPTCHILLVEANDDDRSGHPNLETAVSTAVRLGARYISMSWGSGEFSQQTTEDSLYFSSPGVTYVAASGDSGYQTSWPAASPNVVSVGGTSLVRDRSVPRGWTETAWGNSSGGTGSGCSRFEAQPAWQNIPSLTSVCASRAMNDVAAVADPATGVLVYQNGSWWRYGGTSAATPMIAAMEAIAGTTSGAVSYPYSHQAAFNDVTSGANASCGNLLCQAATGWDGPTGVGTPDGVTGLSAEGAATQPTDSTSPTGSTTPTGSTSPTDSTSPTGSTTPTGPTSSTSPTPPTVTVRNPGTLRGVTGHRVRVRVKATDSAGLPVTYRAAGLPPGTRISGYGYIVGRLTEPGRFRVSVTATDTAGATGDTTFAWRVRAHRIVPSRHPHTSGRPRQGRRLVAVWGNLHRDDRSGPVIHPRVRVQWYLDGSPIKGATSKSLPISRSYRGHRISFRITAVARYYHRYSQMARSTPRVR